MNNNLNDKYLIKTTANGTYTAIADLVDGCRILSVTGMTDIGKAINVYTAQWIGSETEDFLIADTDSFGNPKVVRENPDIEVTFIVSNKYAQAAVDTATQHKAVVALLTSSDVYIKSLYNGYHAHCIALDSYSPKTEKLQRGNSSYILGTIKLHCLEPPTTD